MRRFDFEEDEPDREEIDHFLNSDSQEYLITPEEYKSILEEEMSLHEVKFKGSLMKIRQKVLIYSIGILRRSFFWRFYSLDTKLNQIEKVYNKFVSLLESEEK